MKVPASYYDQIFAFDGSWDMPSKCGLKILEKQGKHIIIVTELYQENPGTSVTYAGASLLLQICRAKGFNVEDTLYIECNPDTHSVLSFYDEAYFLVTFRHDGDNLVDPTYKQLSKEEVAQLFARDDA